jgi:hypothetical protein
MIKTATVIAYQKCKLNGGFFPNKADFKENLWNNEVMVSLSGMCKPANAKDKKWLTLEESMKGFGQTVKFQVGNKSPDPGTRGTADVLLHAAAYHDPRLKQILERKTNSLNDSDGDAFGEALTINVPGG